jgi:hypothetical protein
MAHSHGDTHGHGGVADPGPGYASGLVLTVAALVVLAIIALAVLWAAPWDDNDGDSTPNVPGITDDSGGGGVPDVDPGSGGGAPGGGDGGSGGGSDGGGSAPAP